MTVKITNHFVKELAWQNWHIHRPERLNALGTTLANELTETLSIARRELDPEIRAIVITAETVVKSGVAYWIAGGDLKELADLKQKAEARSYAKTMRLFCEGLESLAVPVVTVLDGLAIGGGAELALAGDIRLATVRSSLDFKQLKLGLTCGYGSTSRLVNLLGKAKAQSILFSCSTLDAETASRDGLIHQLIAFTNLEDIGLQILPLLELEPLAVAAQKKMLRLASTQSSGDQEWADEIFESIWLNETHERNLMGFKTKI